MCLEHFTSELELQFGSQVIPNPGTGTGLTPKALLYHDAVMAGKGKSYAHPRASTSPHASPSPHAGPSLRAGPFLRAGPETGCQSCLKYKQFLHNVLWDVVKHQNCASEMATASENLFILGV